MSWAVNTDIVNGLPDVGANSRPAIFEYNGDLYAVVGNNSTTQGYKFNDVSGAWESFTPIRTFNGSTTSGILPYVFQYNSELYLIAGNSGGTFTGYKWSTANSQWETDIAIIAGLTDIGSYSDATTFELDSELYLVAGKDNGLFSGFKWNTTSSQWEANTAITTGLTDVGSYSAPTTCLLGDKFYFIAGKDSSTFSSFKWNTANSQWESVSFLGYNSTGSAYNRPSCFQYNSTTYVIWGNSWGTLLAADYTPGVKLDTFTFVGNESQTPTVTVTLTEALDPGETLRLYLGETASAIGDDNYLIELTQQDSVTWKASLSYNDATAYYYQVYEMFNAAAIATLSGNDVYFTIAQVETTVINVVAPNYLNPATQHAYNHGLLYYNGYIYGSARATTMQAGKGIIKINANDYTDYLQNSTIPYPLLDQIRECSGFLWLQYYTSLIRVNPSDLSYMVFTMPETGSHSQPIGTDGTYLYFCGNTNIYKLDTSLLIDTPASYGYTDTPVTIPPAALLDNCAIIQYDVIPAYLHSFIADAQYIYLALTTSETWINGYNEDTETYFYHFQKIRKSDMVTVGDVIIPKTTDDMAQNGEYVFLVPEYQGNEPPALGQYWGLFAINKNTLEIKHLNSLHGDFIGDSPMYRRGYGVHVFGNYVAIQLTASDKTIIVDISNISQWGDSLPIGSETIAVYSFQINGSNIPYTPNELVYDSENGVVHINLWAEYTTFLKFPISSLSPAVNEPVIQTTFVSSESNNITIHGTILNPGNSAMTEVGFVYGTDLENLSNSVTSTLGSEFEETILELAEGTYYIMAYGINTEGTWYGNVIMVEVSASGIKWNNVIITKYNSVVVHSIK